MNNETQTTDTLKTHLENLLIEKKSRNGSYSIRALARDLKIDQSHLTRILGGKMQSTPLVAYRLGIYLNLPSEQTLKLIELTV